MEDLTNLELKHTHVLLAKFQLSHELGSALSRLFIPSERDKDLIAVSTKSVTLDRIQYINHEFTEAIGKAHQSFVDYRAPIFIKDRLELIRLNKGTVRINLRPKDQRGFSGLMRTLDAVRPNLTPGVVGFNHYTTIDVAVGSLLATAEERAAAAAEFNEAITSETRGRLHYLSPLEISGYDGTMMAPASPPTDALKILEDAFNS